MSLSLCLRVLRDVADGMRCLHEHATLHLNLRSANLMIFDRFVVKVSDARLRPEWAAMGAQFKRAEGWAAPELLQHVQSMAASEASKEASNVGVGSHGGRHDVTQRSDVYSFGATVFEVIVRDLPLRGCADIPWVVVHRRERPHVPPATEARPRLKPILSLMRRCWAHNPAVSALSRFFAQHGVHSV
eukprot:4452703-Prymnesium_polylepis.1